jgi:N-hydroxyarylamine O-acetyltransferase
MPSVTAYLARIGLTESPPLSAGTLRKLHIAHLYSVPFENLDIGLKRTIVCEAEASVSKIVDRNRGGFCYELNGAFAWLLQELGFKVTLLSARVARQDDAYGPEFDHLALLVGRDGVDPDGASSGEAWLADVGFGDSFIEPLRLISDVEQEQRPGKFRIIPVAEDAYVMQRFDANAVWKAQYKFSLEPRALSDFAGMCHYHQTSPDSHFTQKRICSMATPHGRVTLSELRLIITENGKRQERELTEAEWRPALQMYFGVML